MFCTSQHERKDSNLGMAMRNISSVLSGHMEELGQQKSITDMSHKQLVALASSMSLELEALYKASSLVSCLADLTDGMPPPPPGGGHAGVAGPKYEDQVASKK